MFELCERIYDEFIGCGIGVHIPNGNSVGMWPEECKRLIWAELNSPKLPSVVIGSHNGASEVLIGLTKVAKGDNSEIISVYLNFADFYELNIKRLKSRCNNDIRKLQINSSELDKHLISEIGFALIDGYHSFQQVITDTEVLLPNLTAGSILAYHDCGPKFPKRGIEGYPTQSGEDFYIDEAINKLLENKPLKEIDLKYGMECFHPIETGLNSWVRGTTSPFNSLFLLSYVG